MILNTLKAANTLATLLQLNPPLRVKTKHGDGDAVALADYGKDQASQILVILDAGPWLWLENKALRRATCYTTGNDPDNRISKIIEHTIITERQPAESTLEELIRRLSQE